MLGMSFGEMMVIGVVALMVVGPRNLPAMMRTLGQWVGKLRRMADDMRTQSGIDEILRAEGIHEELQTFRELASGRALLDDPLPFKSPPVVPNREREYPRAGADSYGASPEDIAPYFPVPAELPPASLPKVIDVENPAVDLDGLAPPEARFETEGVLAARAPTAPTLPTDPSPDTNGIGAKPPSASG